MFGYTSVLRTLTQGKGEWTMEYARYSRVADQLLDNVISKWKLANGISEPEKVVKKPKK